MQNSPHSRNAVLNIVLAIVAAISIAHGWYSGAKNSPTIVVNPPIECGPDYIVEELAVSGSQAHYVAIICQAVIESMGSLPVTPRDKTQAIITQSKKWGQEWPGDYKINSADELCDCYGKPFQIEAFRDRVSVTSDSCFAYYFAAIGEKPAESKR
jgi:hypothetical protein